MAKFSCDVQTQVTLASLPSTPMLRPLIVLFIAQSGNSDEHSVSGVHSVDPVVLHRAWLVEFIQVHLKKILKYKVNLTFISNTKSDQSF